MGVNGRTYPGDGEFGFSFGPFVPDCTMGEPCQELHFALGIGCVLRAGKYADVKAWLATPDAARSVVEALASRAREGSR